MGNEVRVFVGCMLIGMMATVSMGQVLYYDMLSEANAISRDGTMVVGRDQGDAAGYTVGDTSVTCWGELSGDDGAYATDVLDDGTILCVSGMTDYYGDFFDWEGAYIEDAFDAGWSMVATGMTANVSYDDIQARVGFRDGTDLVIFGYGTNNLGAASVCEWDCTTGEWTRLAKPETWSFLYDATIYNGSYYAVGSVKGSEENPTFWKDGAYTTFTGIADGRFRAISGDASTLVGEYYTFVDPGWETVGYRWPGTPGVPGATEFALGFRPMAVNYDGSVIAGVDDGEAMFWYKDNAAWQNENLEDFVDGRGVDLSNVMLAEVTDMDDTGRFIVGNRYNDGGGWCIVLPVAWEGSVSSSWGDEDNWFGDIPTADDMVVIDNSGSATTTGGAALSLFVGETSGNSGSLTLSSGTLAIAENMYVGHKGTGTFTQSGGSLTVGAELVIGNETGSAGEYTMTAGSLTVDDFGVGVGGDGELDIQDDSCSITIDDDFTLGAYATLSITDANTPVVMNGLTPGFFITGQTDANGASPQYHENLAGLSKLHLTASFASTDTAMRQHSIEAAGIDTGSLPLASDFAAKNFVIGKLTVGVDADAPGMSDSAYGASLQVVNNSTNQTYTGTPSPEAVYVNTLELLAGARMYPSYPIYYLNGGSPKKFKLADANLDGEVDLDDFVIMKNNFGSTGATWAEGDFNGDRVVDLEDDVILKNNFGI